MASPLPVEVPPPTSPPVGQHTDGTLHLSKVTTRNHSWRLVIDANLEASGAPVNELDGTLGLDVGNGSIHIFEYNFPTVQHAAGHVFSVMGITLHHLVGRLKTRISDVGDTQLLMVVSFLSRYDGRIGHEREVDMRVGHLPFSACAKYILDNIAGCA